MATFEKTYNGTVRKIDDETEEIRFIKFEPEDVGKFIVIKWKYEENMFYGNIMGTRLHISNHDLNPLSDDELYGVYKIEWHSDWLKNENNMRYKVKLTPVGGFRAWCPDRSWYTSDIESHINKTYNLFEEIPIFDEFQKAVEFAIKKNKELYK